ncbi:MAG: glycosyltransferase family 4 protein, partial [Planctomycetota bacterium]
LDALLGEGDEAVRGLEPEILAPPGDSRAGLDLSHIPVRRVGALGGHRWEQLHLAAAARGSVLFCPANTAPLVALRGGQRTVVTLHSISFLERPESYRWAFRRLYRLLAARALRRADAVITVSRSERDLMLARFPQAAGRLHVIENGALPRAFAGELETPEKEVGPVCGKGSRHALFVGSLTPGKNLEGLLEALTLVNRKAPLDLRVVGSAGRGLSAAATPVPGAIRERVRFEGQVNDSARLVRFYRQATCLVHPSLYESSGLPPLEAMACGCPVIVSRLAALEDRCGDAALYCDPGAPRDLAARIEELLGDGDLRAELISRGRARAAALRWTTTVRETLHVIRNVVGSSTPRQA